jgi:hypothetical protein
VEPPLKKEEPAEKEGSLLKTLFLGWLLFS